MINQLYANVQGVQASFPLDLGISFGVMILIFLFIAAFAAALIALKGYSLWHAAKRDEKGWFIALLLINTMGILEIVYLYVIVGKWKTPKTHVHGEHKEHKA